MASARLINLWHLPGQNTYGPFPSLVDWASCLPLFPSMILNKPVYSTGVAHPLNNYVKVRYVVRITMK